MKITSKCFNEIFVDIGWKFGDLQICIPEDGCYGLMMSTYADNTHTLGLTATLDEVITPDEYDIDVSNTKDLLEYLNTRFDEDDIDVWWCDGMEPIDYYDKDNENMVTEDLREFLEEPERRAFIRETVIKHIKER